MDLHLSSSYLATGKPECRTMASELPTPNINRYGRQKDKVFIFNFVKFSVTQSNTRQSRQKGFFLNHI